MDTVSTRVQPRETRCKTLYPLDREAIPRSVLSTATRSPRCVDALRHDFTVAARAIFACCHMHFSGTRVLLVFSPLTFFLMTGNADQADSQQ